MYVHYLLTGRTGEHLLKDACQISERSCFVLRGSLESHTGIRDPCLQEVADFVSAALRQFSDHVRIAEEVGNSLTDRSPSLEFCSMVGHLSSNR